MQFQFTKTKHQQLINNKQYEELFKYSEHNVTVTETLSSKIHSPQVLYKSLEQFLHIEQCNEQCHQLSAAYLWELSQSGVNICTIKIKQWIQELHNPSLGRSTFQTLDPKAMSTNTCRKHYSNILHCNCRDRNYSNFSRT